MIVELNRRLVKGYTYYQNDPRIVKLKKQVLDYNKQLRHLGLRDHQVEYAKFSFFKVVFTLIYRLSKLAVMAAGTLPGLILFAPVFIATKIISVKKSKEALAASTVKIQGRDVMATWKLLVALAFAPILYVFYSILFTYWTYRNRVQGYVPAWVPIWTIPVVGMILFPSITFAALRIGEIGMDILKSLRPLVLSLNPSSANTLVRLRERRKQLSHDVTELINTLGPEMFPDFDSARIIADPFRPGTPTTNSRHQRELSLSRSEADLAGIGSEPNSPTIASITAASMGKTAQQGTIPKNESFGNLANIGLFASRPPSRSRSRSSSSGGYAGSGSLPLKAFSTMSTKGSFDEVSKKIRGAMRERGLVRRQSEEEGKAFDVTASGLGVATPGSEEGGGKEI
jgi:glycerol-3-phosphate O-acyltransferase / dihydroxyacetone phosphate acyltransferase